MTTLVLWIIGIYLMIGMVFSGTILMHISRRLKSIPGMPEAKAFAIVWCFIKWSIDWLPIAVHYWRRRK